MAVREWKEGKGGTKVPISPAFVRKVEALRIANSLSRAEFRDGYGMGTSTYNVWKKFSTNKLVDSVVVFRICQQLHRKLGVQFDQLGLPDITVELLRRVQSQNALAQQANEVAAGVANDDSKNSLLLTIDIRLRPDEHEVLEKLKADVMAIIPKYAKHFISFGFRPGSLILRLQLTPESAHHLIEAAEAGAFAFAGYQSYRVIPQIDASELSLTQQLALLAEFARRIDRCHALDVGHGDVSLARMYSGHLDSVIMFSDSLAGYKASEKAASSLELESLREVDGVNELSIPLETLIPNEIRALGALLIRILNGGSAKNSASDLPWWQQLSNEAVVAPANVENVDQLRSVVAMAIDLDPRRQLPTAGEFANAIDALLRGEFSKYNCDARRKQLLAWRAGIAFGKLERRSKLLQEALSDFTVTGDGEMRSQVFALARNVSDDLIDIRRFLIGLNGSVASREVFEIAEQVAVVSQWVASAEIAALNAPWLAVWLKNLMEHESVAWTIAGRTAEEIYRLALNADTLVQNDGVDMHWRQSAAMDGPMQSTLNRILLVAQDSRHWSDVQVRAAILNREMIRYLRWSVIEEKLIPPEFSHGGYEPSDMRFFEGLLTSLSQWSIR